MNILFFLTPKNDVAFIYSDANLREAIDLMEAHGYSALPILTKQGRYAGTLTEGDLLWGMKTLNVPNLKAAEGISIMAIPRRATYKAVHADSDMEDLLDKAINQNYVPVVDDQGYFIGIITRKEIIKYCYKELKKYVAASNAEKTESQIDSPEN
jgi:CBS domain-containing protein